MTDLEGTSGVSLQNGIYVKMYNLFKYKADNFASTVRDLIFGGKIPFFQRELESGNRFLHKLSVDSCGKEKDIVSNDCLIIHLNELNFLPTYKGKSIIDSSDSRLTSRFLKMQKTITALIIDSSTTGPDSTVETFLATDPKAKDAFVVRVNAWNTHEGLGIYGNYGWFWVYCGSSGIDPFIVPNDKKPEDFKMLDPDRFIEVPMELHEEFERNIVLALQEKAGISTRSTSNFFKDTDRLNKAFTIQKHYDDVITLDFYDRDQTIMQRVFDDLSLLPLDRKLYGRVDCGTTSDLFGVSVGYADGLIRNTIDGLDTDQILIKIPLSFALSRLPGQETSYSKVTDFFIQLAKTHNLALVTYDSYQCFTGDTKVKLLDGTTSTMIELEERFNKGEEIFTYSLDLDKKKLAPGKIIGVQKTGKRKIMKVILDNDQEIRCSYDHLFMMRDGTFKPAEELKEFDSLMPLYTNENPKGYELVYNPLSDSWGLTHGKIFNYVYGSTEKKHIHHKDFNKHNNNPTNFELLTRKEHIQKHADHTAEVFKDPQKKHEAMVKMWQRPGNEERRAKASVLMKNIRTNLMEDLEFRKSLSENCIFKRPEIRELGRIATQKSYDANDGQRRKEQAARITEINKTRKPRLGTKTAQWALEKMSNTMREVWERPGFKEKMSKRYPGSTRYLQTHYGKDYKSKLSPEELEAAKREARAEWEKTHVINHKVKAVIFTEDVEDVYDICIDGLHNYALDAGVFVHNSTMFGQILNQAGIETKMRHNDRNDNDYVILKQCIYQGLISLPENALLHKELAEIQRVSPTRVDHPTINGSKDISDCVAGIVAEIVERGPEEVLAPPDSMIQRSLADAYINMTRNRGDRFIRSTVSDYLNSF